MKKLYYDYIMIFFFKKKIPFLGNNIVVVKTPQQKNGMLKLMYLTQIFNINLNNFN